MVEEIEVISHRRNPPSAERTDVLEMFAQRSHRPEPPSLDPAVMDRAACQERSVKNKIRAPRLIVLATLAHVDAERDPVIVAG